MRAFGQFSLTFLYLVRGSSAWLSSLWVWFKEKERVVEFTHYKQKKKKALADLRKPEFGFFLVVFHYVKVSFLNTDYGGTILFCATIQD